MKVYYTDNNGNKKFLGEGTTKEDLIGIIERDMAAKFCRPTIQFQIKDGKIEYTGASKNAYSFEE